MQRALAMPRRTARAFAAMLVLVLVLGAGIPDPGLALAFAPALLLLALFTVGVRPGEKLLTGLHERAHTARPARAVLLPRPQLPVLVRPVGRSRRRSRCARRRASQLRRGAWRAPPSWMRRRAMRPLRRAAHLMRLRPHRIAGASLASASSCRARCDPSRRNGTAHRSPAAREAILKPPLRFRRMRKRSSAR